jgi:hypothetical protein
VAAWINAGVDDREVIIGKVGEGSGTKYLAFRELMNDLPDIDGVLLNPDTAPVPDNPSAQWLVSSTLATRLNAQNFGSVLKYLNRLPQMFRAFTLRDSMRAESVMTAEKRLPKGYRPISSSRDFAAWVCSTDGKEIIGAAS